MTAPNEANRILMGSSGPPAAAFPYKGTRVTGIVLSEPEQKQQMNKKMELLTWDNGDPRWVILVVLQTDLRDPARPDDDGKRTLWIGGRMQKVMREAIRDAGAPGLEIGARVTVDYIDDDGDAKVYACRYERPPARANVALMGSTSNGGHPAQNVPPTYVPQAERAQAPAGGYFPPLPPPAPTYNASAGYGAASAAMGLPVPELPLPPGVDPEMWARMDAATRAQVSDAMSKAPF